MSPNDHRLGLGVLGILVLWFGNVTLPLRGEAIITDLIVVIVFWYNVRVKTPSRRDKNFPEFCASLDGTNRSRL
jgi:hypothetical protein